MNPLNPSGLCGCGCGRITDRAATSRRGYKRGEHLRFIRGHSSRKPGPPYAVDDNGCWIWQHHIDPRHGYGRTWDGERVIGAHVFFYRQYVGVIPEGCDVHHRCGVRACVNPDHLEALSRRAHMLTEGRRPYGNSKAQVH